MADSALVGFFQILTGIIRVGDRLPFTCFIRLSQNQKIIPYLLIDDVVGEERIKKLDKFGHVHLYIQDPQKEAYYEYLRKRLQDEDGAGIKSTIEENIKLGNLSGLPTDENGIRADFLKALDENIHVKGGVTTEEKI